MAKLTMDINPDAILEAGTHTDETLLKMIKAGQDVMANAIKQSASKHIKTGSLVNSIKETKAVIDKNDCPVGRVKFIGDDKNGMANSAKALWLEYGTTKQRPTPFVRPAIQGCQTEIYNAMKQVEQEEQNNK